jgi:hypothetical protein
LAKPTVGSENPNPCCPRIARVSSLLSGSTNRDPLNRPWSVAEYTFGDAIRRHEAQYAARAAAALAAASNRRPTSRTTRDCAAGTPEHEEDQQMQQHSSEYWTAHFRKQIAERPDIQPYLDEQAANDFARGVSNSMASSPRKNWFQPKPDADVPRRKNTTGNSTRAVWARSGAREV